MNTVPAILPHSFEEIGEKLSRIEGLVERVQIDICDGLFGREKTWYPNFAVDKLPEGFQYEFDIMVNEWRQCVEACLLYSPSYLVVHVDGFTHENMTELIELVRPHDIPLGLSVSNDTEVDFLADLVRLAQESYGYNKIYIQVMGIRSVGEQAQAFDLETVERVLAVKRVFGDTELQVDGGMKPDTALEVMKAGAVRAICGSYIFGVNDSGLAYNEMKNVGEIAGSYEE